MAAVAAIGGLVGGTMMMSIADAATNPGDTVAANCTTDPNVGSQSQNVSFKVSGPDSVEAGAATTFTIEPVEVTLPAEAQGQAIDSYENIRTSVEVYGASVSGTSISTPGQNLNSTATVAAAGNVVTVTIPGPIAGGSTITTPGVAIQANVTAATGATTGVRPANPFYQLTVNTIITVTATCTPADAAAAAAGTLTIPVAGEDTAGPNITVTSPYAGAIYGYQQVVKAAYSCTDPSGVASCVGTDPVGAAIDTSTQGAKSFTVNATDSKGNAASKSIDYLVLPPGVEPPPPPTYTPLNPGRLLDTRAGGATVDGQGAGGGATAPGQTIELQVAGRHGIPEDAVAAVLNITATETQGWGYATVYPCGDPQPNASNLNYTDAGDTRPNAVVTKLGAGGKVCIFTGEAGAQLLADVAGFFPPGAAYESLNPGRILDTRAGGATVDGEGAGGGAATPGQTIELQVAGRHGVPGDAEAVVLNLTATDTQGWGYVTAYPCGEPQPNASNLNYTEAGQTTPNAVVTKLGADGKVCIFTGEAGTQLLADVAGYFPAGSGYTPLNPARVLDSRPGSSTIDGAGTGDNLGLEGAALPAGSTITLPIAGRGGVAAGATGAVLNITMTDTQGWGYVTAYPCDAERPNASNLNSTAAGQTRPNAVFTKLDANGDVCLYVAEGATHLIVDVDGYFPKAEGPVIPPFEPPTTTTTTTLPGQTTTSTSSTTLPPDAEAPAECGEYGSQVEAQINLVLLRVQGILDPAAAAQADAIDPNGNGIACEDYPF